MHLRRVETKCCVECLPVKRTNVNSIILIKRTNTHIIVNLTEALLPPSEEVVLHSKRETRSTFPHAIRVPQHLQVILLDVLSNKRL